MGLAEPGSLRRQREAEHFTEKTEKGGGHGGNQLRADRTRLRYWL